MVPVTDAWEEDYSRRGLLWGGVTHDLPLLPPGSRVLELGCGNGKTLLTMVQRGWEVTALDISPRAVALSRERCRSSSDADFIIADSSVLPFKNMTFDAVFAVHLMGHLPGPDRKRLPYGLFPTLRPGGIIFFSDFSTEDFRYGSGCELELATFRRGTGIITHYFSRQEVLDLFSPFTPVSVSIQRWKMRVRGKDLVRSEIKGIFTR